MPRTPELRILACSLAAAVMLLDGCVPGMSSKLITEPRNERFAELKKAYIVTVPQPPTESDLAVRLGMPTVYRVEDISLHAYELDYEELKLLHDEMRSAAGREDESSGICEGAECFFLPFILPVLIMDAPFAAVGLALKEDERAKQIEDLTGRFAVFAYDADGNYRWQGCCYSPGLMDNRRAFYTRFPYPTNSAWWPQGFPDAYRADYRVLSCKDAKMGFPYVRNALFQQFNKTVPDAVQTYYWARVASEASNSGKMYLEWAENSLPPKDLKAGEKYFRSHPLEAVDCRDVVEMLIEAESSGSKGPNVGP